MTTTIIMMIIIIIINISVISLPEIVEIYLRNVMN